MGVNRGKAIEELQEQFQYKNKKEYELHMAKIKQN